MLGVVLLRGLFDLGAALTTETLAQRLSRDARDEIYVSLLGKSQTFHNRQQVGDLMARTANDVRQLGMMVNPGLSLIFDSMTALVVPIVTIALLDPRLLPPPLIFTVFFIISLRFYMKRLTPASMAMRTNFGKLNSGLAEAVTGIDVVKSTAQEEQEDAKFDAHATAYKNAFVEQGLEQARYLPPLLLGATIASSLLLGIYYHSQGELTIGRLVTYIGLISLLRFPTFISIFTFSLVAVGLVSAQPHPRFDQRGDRPRREHWRAIRGKIAGRDPLRRCLLRLRGEPVLKMSRSTPNRARPSRSSGETGSGKSTLTKLVNRIYDVPSRAGADRWRRRARLESGLPALADLDDRAGHRPLLPTDRREHRLQSRPGRVDGGRSQRAARDAQADDSSARCQTATKPSSASAASRFPAANANGSPSPGRFLTDPRILILDDSTSAIDSATEDQIQRAIKAITADRTTILITHRLSQIRWADKVLVLRHGRGDRLRHARRAARALRSLPAHLRPL